MVRLIFIFIFNFTLFTLSALAQQESIPEKSTKSEEPITTVQNKAEKTKSIKNNKNKKSNTQSKTTNPTVEIKTSKGNITLELDKEKAPISVKNFLDYVKNKHYDKTIFHRVIDNFMIQGGGFDKDMNEKTTKDPIKNEADNGLKNEKYTIAMARTQVVDSATSQFYINVKNNDDLNHKDSSPRGYGYAVFGRVIKGQDVVDKIKSVKTKSVSVQGQSFDDVPQETIFIESIELL